MSTVKVNEVRHLSNSGTENISKKVTYISTSKPKIAFYRLAQLFKKTTTLKGIHPSSVISPEAKIDASAYIGPFCYIEKCDIKANFFSLFFLRTYD